MSGMPPIGSQSAQHATRFIGTRGTGLHIGRFDLAGTIARIERNHVMANPMDKPDQPQNQGKPQQQQQNPQTGQNPQKDEGQNQNPGSKDQKPRDPSQKDPNQRDPSP